MDSFPVEYSGFPTRSANPRKIACTWKTWQNSRILKDLIKILEKWYRTGKNWVGTKSSPAQIWRPQCTIKIIFQKKIFTY